MASKYGIEVIAGSEVSEGTSFVGGMELEIGTTNSAKVSGVGISTIQGITQEDFDALVVKDPNTFYVITTA